jgi:hypothetical protein
MAANKDHRRNFREKRVIYIDRELIERFCLNSDGILFMESLIREEIFSGSHRKQCTTLLQKVLLTLTRTSYGSLLTPTPPSHEPIGGLYSFCPALQKFDKT